MRQIRDAELWPVAGYSSVAVDVSLVVVASSCPIIITVSPDLCDFSFPTFRSLGCNDPDPVTSRLALSFLVKQPGGLGYKLHSKCSKCFLYCEGTVILGDSVG